MDMQKQSRSNIASGPEFRSADELKRDAQTQSNARAKDALFDVVFCVGVYSALRSTPNPIVKAGAAWLAAVCAMKTAAHLSPDTKIYEGLQNVATLMQPWGHFGLFLSVFGEPKNAFEYAKLGVAFGGSLEIGRTAYQKMNPEVFSDIMAWFSEYEGQLNQLEKEIDNLMRDGSSEPYLPSNIFPDSSPYADDGESVQNPDEVKMLKPGVGEGALLSNDEN